MEPLRFGKNIAKKASFSEAYHGDDVTIVGCIAIVFFILGWPIGLALIAFRKRFRFWWNSLSGWKYICM